MMSAPEIVIKTEKDDDVVEIKDDQDEDDEISELEHLRKLFIGGLSPQTTEANLRNFYGKFGKVVDAVVMRDPSSKRSRGFGFVTFTKSLGVNNAMDSRPHVIDDRTVEPRRALPRPTREFKEKNISVKKLFVGGLKDNHDEECLREHFSQFGKVVSVKILMDITTGKRRGFAFVEFDDYDSVDKAILHKQHLIKYVVLDVKKSVYKQEQQKRQPNGSTNDEAASTSNNIKNTYQQKPPPKLNGPPYAAPPPKPQYGYQRPVGPPPPQQPMPYQQPPPTMNGFQPGPPPPNYNYWGPPPPPAQYPYNNAYPPQGPPPNWNCPPPTHAWNAGPPQGPPPAAPAWQPNQWGYPPPQPPPAGAPPNHWNAPPAVQPAPIRQVPPPGTVPPVPPTQPLPTVPATAVPQNFGTGYQQNYGGGPVKHTPTNANRMNPYAPNGPAVPTATPVPPVGGRYRR